LCVQPETTPLIFSWYVASRRAFTTREDMNRLAGKVAQRLSRLLEVQDLKRVGFLGRIGYARPAPSRSLRLPLERLVVTTPAAPRDAPASDGMSRR
jgi:hypothetical protein